MIGRLGAINFDHAVLCHVKQNRLTSGSLGSYTYGDGVHLHAATAIGSGGTNGYTASYDASGNMTCRAPYNTATCVGTPPGTGAQLSYNNEGRLSGWQNAPSSPTTTDSFLYDGEGNRVEQQVTINGSMTTTTTYVSGGLEEISNNGTGSTLTKYFTGASGLPTAERVGTGGPLSYLATDGQGTVSTSLDSAGTVTSSQLYTPYGNARYSSGSSPTTLGYTGQRADSATGLDYYQARYYDLVAGQFVSADTANDGLNRYGYVHGNPTTATDPSGHRICYDMMPSSCMPNAQPSSGGLPIIVETDKDTHEVSKRNEDGTWTTTTYTTLRYVWSNGSVTSESWSSSKTFCDAKCSHLRRARDLDRDAAGKAAWAGLLAVGAAVVDMLYANLEHGLEDMVVIAGILINLLPYAAQAFGVSSGLYEFIQRTTSALNYLASIALSAIALIRNWGTLAEVAVNSAYLAVRAGVEGIPGAVETIAAKALGGLLTAGLNAASAQMFGQYYQLEAEATHERDVAASLPDGV